MSLKGCRYVKELEAIDTLIPTRSSDCSKRGARGRLRKRLLGVHNWNDVKNLRERNRGRDVVLVLAISNFKACFSVGYLSISWITLFCATKKSVPGNLHAPLLLDPFFFLPGMPRLLQPVETAWLKESFTELSLNRDFFIEILDSMKMSYTCNMSKTSYSTEIFVALPGSGLEEASPSAGFKIRRHAQHRTRISTTIHFTRRRYLRWSSAPLCSKIAFCVMYTYTGIR